MSLKTLIKEATFLARSLIFKQVGLLLVVFGFTSLLNITLQDTVASLDNTQENLRLMMQLTVGVWDLIAGVITLMLLVSTTASIRSLKEPPFLAQPFAQPFFISYIAEALRALAKSLLWSLLFIVPGFIKYCRFIFVPFITLFSSEYRAGRVDALELSTKLTKGRMGVIIGVVLITGAIDFAFELLPLLSPAFHMLPIRVTFDGLSFLLSIWSFSFFFVLFEEALPKESSNQTETTA